MCALGFLERSAGGEGGSAELDITSVEVHSREAKELETYRLGTGATGVNERADGVGVVVEGWAEVLGGALKGVGGDQLLEVVRDLLRLSLRHAVAGVTLDHWLWERGGESKERHGRKSSERTHLDVSYWLLVITVGYELRVGWW